MDEQHQKNGDFDSSGDHYGNRHSGPSGSPGASAPSCNLSSSGSYGGWGYSNCSGVKQHQVKVLCEENSGNRYTAYGSWKASGATSSARCHEYAWLVTVGVNYTV